jgi:Animal haem peroxidase
MPRLKHGGVIPLEQFRIAREALTTLSASVPSAFAAMRPANTRDFDFLFRELQHDPGNLLPEAQKTRDDLISLGRTMQDTGPAAGSGDSSIPAAYTYFGQFVDHDVTLEAHSASLIELLDPNLTPLTRREIQDKIRNTRTATLELDSVYGSPAPRNGDKMKSGQVTALNGTSVPQLRPPGKDDDNDLPREPRSLDPDHDRAALTGDPRNDENLVVAQLHVAFLRAHNKLVDQGETFGSARRILRRHYQHIILHDFLKRIADPQIVDETIQSNRIYDPKDERFFLPLEFSVAAYRFGHTLVREVYDFNLNFNTSGQPGTVLGTLDLLFTFTALSGGLGFGQGTDTLPDNWIIEWENFVDVGVSFNKARRIDTKLVEPLFHLRNVQGVEEQGDGARLAVRNLLRGYLLRLPTGQAVARALKQKLQGVHNIPVLSAQQIRNGAHSQQQAQVLQQAGFLERTPLWYYILAEAAVLGNGQRLGPVGSTIVAEVLVGLMRRSPNSILNANNPGPDLPSEQSGTFTLSDLLRFAGVLP